MKTMNRSMLPRVTENMSSVGKSRSRDTAWQTDVGCLHRKTSAYLLSPKIQREGLAQVHLYDPTSSTTFQSAYSHSPPTLMPSLLVNSQLQSQFVIHSG